MRWLASPSSICFMLVLLNFLLALFLLAPHVAHGTVGFVALLGPIQLDVRHTAEGDHSNAKDVVVQSPDGHLDNFLSVCRGSMLRRVSTSCDGG